MFKRLRGRKAKRESQSGESVGQRPAAHSELDEAHDNGSYSSLDSHGDRLNARTDPEREISVVSKFEISQLGLVPPILRSRQSSRDRRADPLGLTVLHRPSTRRLADIIFVHGLGGSSFATWSKHKDPDLCWPQRWLPSEPDISFARIMTFGYDAHFASMGPTSVSNITDFAKALLFDMKFGRDEYGQDLDIGQVPIIFVVHSMGGIVFKKSYLMGQNNPDYSPLVAQIRSVIFLSTPHRGTNLSNILNGLLSVSLAGHTSKQYISDLNKNSAMIEDVNENFRNIAPQLQIFSFYETLETSVAFRSLMVLDKNSSILGYPGEISRPLDADHHCVCKYLTANDPNYKSVRSALINALKPYCYDHQQTIESRCMDNGSLLMNLTGISGPLDEDYADLKSQWQPGTCDALLEVPTVTDWMKSSTQSSILWAYAQPGSGKSICSTFLIDHLKNNGCICAYFFFRYMDSTKRSLKAALLSLALQMAEYIPAYKARLADLYRDGLRLEKADARLVWQQLFMAPLSNINAPQPICWVIDALDESDSASAAIEILSGISALRVPIRLFVTSRDLPFINNAFSRISTSPIFRTCLDNNEVDIRTYTERELQHMLGTRSIRQGVVDRVVERAKGNFLWVTLATKQITDCHNADEIQEAIRTLPPGMDALYGRMEADISNLTRANDRDLAMTILTWAVFARRPLTRTEILSVLQPNFSEPIDFRHTVSELCGHFVVIDSTDKITLVHQTARDYLLGAANLGFSLDPKIAHENLFQRSIHVFFDTAIRSKLRQGSMPTFYDYAATSWPYHLGSMHSVPNDILDVLVKFFRAPYVLPWIHTLARLKQLKVLIYASRHLNSSVRKRRKQDASKMPLLHGLSDLSLLEAWAVDLLKLAGKYGNCLLQDPAGIYRYVTEFCPGNSMIHQAGKSTPKEIRVTGITNIEWDDRLARISVGTGNQASIVSCCGRYLLVVTTTGCLFVWNALVFELLWTLDLQQHVFRACFSDNGESLAAYGFSHTIILRSSSGRELQRVPNLPDVRPLCITFGMSDKTLIIASDSRELLQARLDIEDQIPKWAATGTNIMHEDTAIAGTFLNSPTAVAFSPDMAELAVAYRGFPLTVWSLSDARPISRCKRRGGLGKALQKSWTGVNRVCWHPKSGDILGIYTDGMVFRWNPIQETHEELRIMDTNATPSEIECSPDGHVFATSDVNGTVKLYSFHHMSLIYQLASEDIVTALCFSPDSRRFYDLRGSYCDAWEPNALLRITDSEELIPDAETEAGSTIVSFSASEAFVDSSIPITALAVWENGGFIYTGDEEGKLEVLDMNSEMQHEICSSGSQMSIDCIACSDDGTCIAYTNLEGRLVILAQEEGIERSKHGPPRYRTVLDEAISLNLEPIHQILFSPGSRFLLTASQTSAQTWSIEANRAHLSSPVAVANGPTQWSNHPHRTGQLLSITPETICIFDWSTLGNLGQWALTLSTSAMDNSDADARPSLPRNESSQNELKAFNQTVPVLEDVIFSQDKQHLLLAVSERDTLSRRRHKTYFLDTRALVLEKHPDEAGTEAELVLHLKGHPVLKPLGVLESNQLVFVDTSLWICTTRLASPNEVTEPHIVKHFFLPTDWMSEEGLRMCCMTSDGTLLVPRKHEVAVIRNSIMADW